MTPPIAVVIPTLNDADELALTLAALLNNPPQPLEVVVVDGGSVDATRKVARAHGVKVIDSAPGRGRQLHAGAVATTGDPLVFVHADTRLGPHHLSALVGVLEQPAVSFGSFPIRFVNPSAGLRLIAWAANLRTAVDRTPYGDQAMFVRRASYAEVGGFPDEPILEDVILARRLRASGRFVLLTALPVVTSGRRWSQEGTVRTTGCNVAIRVLWELGVRPATLRYLRRRDGPDRVLDPRPEV